MKVIEIQNATLGIQHMPGLPKPWRMTIQDREAGEVHWLDLDDATAKKIAEKLSTGIQIAKTMP